MKSVYAGIAATLIVGVAYFWVVPLIKDYISERNIADIERDKKEAQKKVELAKLKAESDMKNLCTASQVDFLTETKSATDGGTKPNTSVTATIKSKSGFFIFEPTVEVNHTGSIGFREGTKSLTPLPKYKDTLFENTVLASASYTVRCSKGQNLLKLGTDSCQAVAKITAIQYSTKCINYMVDKAKNDEN